MKQVTMLGSKATKVKRFSQDQMNEMTQYITSQCPLAIQHLIELEFKSNPIHNKDDHVLSYKLNGWIGFSNIFLKKDGEFQIPTSFPRTFRNHIRYDYEHGVWDWSHNVTK